jgi:hypothetical protein
VIGITVFLEADGHLWAIEVHGHLRSRHAVGKSQDFRKIVHTQSTPDTLAASLKSVSHSTAARTAVFTLFHTASPH